ncbi:polyprenyl synthetase family protein [Patescibacteria group bacterium]|nr:polyprenyl synthetase family protein [Patescibacteria group bacterium]
MKKNKDKFKYFYKDLLQYQKEINSELKRFFNKKIKESSLIFKQAAETIRILKQGNIVGGKRIRPILINVGYSLAGGKNKKSILKASLSIELLHNYFLIHDDIIDRDELRRGKKSLYSFYKNKTNDLHKGISLAIVGGDITISLAYQAILESNFLEKNKIKALEILNQTNINTCHGQMLEMFLESKPNKITEKEIFNILKNKTAYYTFANPLKIGAVLAGSNNKFLSQLEKIGLSLGIAFQIRDDILDLFGSEKELGKPVASDIKEGKPNLLILKTLALAKPKDKKIFKEYLGKKIINQKDIKEIRRIVTESRALDYCQNKAWGLVKKASFLIKKMKVPQKEKEFLLNLADYIIERKF